MEIPFIFKNDILKDQWAFITGGGSGLGLAMAHRMAEAKQGPLRVGFNRRLYLEFHLRFLYLAIGLGLLAWVLT